MNQTVIVLVSPLFLCMHAVTDIRLPSFKGPKEGSHDHGWEREWEETLPSPSPSSLLPLQFSLRFIIYWYNSKYQSKGPIYILHLFAFNLHLDFFNLCIFEKRKRDSGKRWKKCGMQDFRGKGEGMRDQKSPPPPSSSRPWMMQTKFNWVFAHSTLRSSHTWTKEMSDDVEC